MKLRVRISRQTSKVELLGEDPSLKELKDLIKDTLVSSHRLSAETEFGLSLNGSELLTDSGQTLASCGIVSGDLICVVLPPSANDGSTSSTSSTSTTSTTSSTSSTSRSSENQRQQQTQQTAAMTSNQLPAALSESEETSKVPDSSTAAAAASSWEPMLCSEAEDGEAPLSLELLHHSAQTAGPSDAIMVAGHLLMIETGFVPQGDELKVGEMPAGWRSPAGVYKLQYSHPLCDSSTAMLVAVNMGAMLVINAILKMNETADSVGKLCLNPSDYVTDKWTGESAAAAFRDLNKLSRLFKDQLAYPLIAAARQAMALPVAFGLAVLPPELLLRIFRLLDVCSLLRLASVSRHLNICAAESSLWRYLYRRDFSDRDVSRSRDTDWRELYKRFYKIRRDQRLAAQRFPPFLRNPEDIFSTVPVPVPVPLHPPLPGIIGGEYDQRPDLPRILLPRPRHDPIGPPLDLNPRLLGVRPMGGRPADIRRGFI